MRGTVTGTFLVLALAAGGTAQAQSWRGLYIGGSIGGGSQRGNASEAVRFDTDLDGTFTDSVRTIAGVNAFSPGFCGGLAVNATASGGCTSDENGIDFGGRVGYDWQVGRVVVGAVVDITKNDVTDSVTAFSVTPAFYAFTRELRYVAGLRGRIGLGTGRALVYGTGGAAWGNIKQAFATSNGVNTFVAVQGDGGGPTGVVGGYQAGGGIELKIRSRWSLTGEYLFTAVDDRAESTIRAMGPAPATNPFILVNSAGTSLQRTQRLDVHAGRVGLNYRF